MTTHDQILGNIEEMACRMRKNALDLALSAGNNGAHLGSGLSIIEIMAVLYGGVIKVDPNNPRWVERDGLFLVKDMGH